MSKRPFVGHVVSGRAVTMKDGKDAGIMKQDPQEQSFSSTVKLFMKDGTHVITTYLLKPCSIGDIYSINEIYFKVTNFCGDYYEAIEYDPKAE